jgi:hypothetical protein
VSDTWEGLLQQLAIVLGRIFEKLIQDALGWSLVIAWLAWCLFGINWKRAWGVLAGGAWMPLVLLLILVSLAWAEMTPEKPAFFEKLAIVCLVAAATLFCGWVQGYFSWEPAEMELEPAVEPANAHGHGHH